MDLTLCIASWIAAVGSFLAFGALAVYALALRRAARSQVGDPLGPRRAQDATALGCVAVALAIGTQLVFAPFYARSFWGRTVRATFVKVVSSGGKSPTFTVHAKYKDASGRMQPVEDRVSQRAYLRYYDMSFDCRMAEIQGQVDREYATRGMPNPLQLSGNGPGPRCVPVDFVVVDGVPSFAQIGSWPCVPAEGVVGSGVLWAILLFGLRREGRARSS